MTAINLTMMLTAAAAVLVTTMTAGVGHAADPAAYRAQVMRNPNLHNLDGEHFTWHARSGVNRFFQGYLAYEDEQWLHEAGIYLDWLVEQMATEPDGYKGWVGSRMGSDGSLRGPHVVGDANLIEPMLRFAEIVADDASLQPRFGAQADNYVKLALHVIEKWDERGSWEVDGDFAVYTQQDTWVRADDPGKFVSVPELKRTENMNKSGKMGVVFLRLHRITGDEQWKDRAVKIFSHYKRIMRHFQDEDRYVFNFWEPFGRWDIQEDGEPVGWINVHGRQAAYQASEVGMMVEAYHNGVVFTEQDIQRLVRTNLWMWNGDRNAADFTTSDGRTDAGTLWTALTDFDETIRDLHGRGQSNGNSLANQIDRTYFERVVAPRPIGFERRHVSDTSQLVLPDIPLYESRELNFAAAIPGVVAGDDDEPIYLATQVRGKGTLRVELYQDDQRVATLLEEDVDGTTDFDGRANFKTLAWDGKVDGEDVPAGSYTVRWTLNDSRRERGLRLE